MNSGISNLSDEYKRIVLGKVDKRLAKVGRTLLGSSIKSVFRHRDVTLREDVLKEMTAEISALIGGDLSDAREKAGKLRRKWETPMSKAVPRKKKLSANIAYLSTFDTLCAYVFEWDTIGREARRCIVLGAPSRICPYCQEHLVRIVRNAKRQEVRYPDIDHWISRHHEPLLSLNFQNLVPACSVCNAVKGKKLFRIKKHYHPHAAGQMTSHLRFRVSKIEELFDPKNNGPIPVLMEVRAGSPYGTHAYRTGADLCLPGRYADHDYMLRAMFAQAQEYLMLKSGVCADPFMPSSDRAAEKLLALSGIPLDQHARNGSILGNLKGDVFSQFVGIGV